jgi:hypothetical protein
VPGAGLDLSQQLAQRALVPLDIGVEGGGELSPLSSSAQCLPEPMKVFVVANEEKA